ncbi:MAG TPA: GTPase HflX [Verrucomicrobiae bacterium]|nr:GTPase HflX [Verrucomicrobiae bacterium]
MIGQKPDTRKIDRALLVGIQTPRDDPDTTRDLLAELGELVRSLDIEIADSVMVKLRQMHAPLFVGTGKADELAALAKERGAEIIVFDNPLSPAQQRNWEKRSELCVIDREEVILDIFARRAQTREARLQVGLARLRYSLPRLTRAWTHLSRQAGGIGGRGEGETQLEVDRRIVQQKIQRLRAELEGVRSSRATQRKQRLRIPVPVCAIVGYTNAGKSCLLRALSGAEVLVEDKLFATLDPTTRRIALANGQEILISDTVGFIRRLPHHLVEAFKATLEEATLADLIIHVLDVTNPQIFEFHRTTLDVLRELGVDQKPTILAFNKIDLQPPPEQLAAIRSHFDDPLFISSITGDGLPALLHRISARLDLDLATVRLDIPHDKYPLVAKLHQIAKVIETQHLDDGTRIVASLPHRHLDTFRPFLAPAPTTPPAAMRVKEPSSGPPR